MPAVESFLNRESPRRGFEFARERQLQGRRASLRASWTRYRLVISRLSAIGEHAREYVTAMRLLLQQPTPDDYLIATGETHTVREFAEIAFSYVGLDYRKHVILGSRIIPAYGSDHATRRRYQGAHTAGWAPQTRFETLVREMVETTAPL